MHLMYRFALIFVTISIDFGSIFIKQGNLIIIPYKIHLEKLDLMSLCIKTAATGKICTKKHFHKLLILTKRCNIVRQQAVKKL